MSPEPTDPNAADLTVPTGETNSPIVPPVSGDDTDIPNTDLADIRTKWLRFCSHDLGLPYQCICPDEDVRPVLAALVGEVEGLRAEVATLNADAEVEVERLNRAIDEQAEGWECTRVALRRYDRAWAKLKAERDVMRPVVEAAKAWVAAVRAADEDDDWADDPYLSLGAALIAAVDQMASSSPPRQPQGDDQGAVAGTDGVEAQEGTRGIGCPKCGSILNAKAANCDGEWHADNRPAVTFVHPCGYGQTSPIPQTCPQCGTTEPWS